MHIYYAVFFISLVFTLLLLVFPDELREERKAVVKLFIESSISAFWWICIAVFVVLMVGAVDKLFG